jgi:hypothetical protein
VSDPPDLSPPPPPQPPDDFALPSGDDHDDYEVSACRRPCWRLRVRGVRTADVVRAFAGLLSPAPAAVTFAVQNTVYAPPVLDFLLAHPSPRPRSIRSETIWPPAPIHQVPATRENLESLAHLLEEHSTSEVFAHLSVYRDADGHRLIGWFDADCGDDVYVSLAVPEATLNAVCARPGAGYELVEPTTAP